MGAVIDDLYDHEGFGARRLPDGTLTATWTAAAAGFGARRLPDGTLTATWTAAAAGFDAYGAACDCGWRGDEDRPPTDAGYEIALEDWERDHARPLLACTVPARVTRMISDLRTEIGALAKERPAAAQQALREVQAWTDSAMAFGPRHEPTAQSCRPSDPAIAVSWVCRRRPGRPRGAGRLITDSTKVKEEADGRPTPTARRR
jgi:hypothetical protein